MNNPASVSWTAEWWVSIRLLFSIKNAALAFLVLQNTFLVVFMRYSRTVDGPLYASSTAVVVMELMKFVTCIGVVTYESGGSAVAAAKAINEEVFQKPMELLKVGLPSLLYSIQNNLLYFALSHLDAATYQVGYQLKILTTAVFSVILLKKTISSTQWLSLVLLTVGVSMAQLSSQSAAPGKENTLSGFVAVLLATCTSGFAGVFFEMMLKGSPTTLWMRNIQMGVGSILSGILGLYFSGDWPSIRDNGFFYGYSYIVWAVIVLQAIGGLLVAVVVKYADNILKGFAASFSIITSFILCIWVFNFRPTFTFIMGALLVNISMYMYSSYPAKEVKQEEGKV